MSDTAQNLADCEDYDTIAAAVAETARGRWFLAEHARRCRMEGTDTIVAELAALRRMVEKPARDARSEALAAGLAEMAEAIALTHVEVGKIQPQTQGVSRLFEASGELQAVVNATENATTAILGAAERVQEHAWLMRERGHPDSECDSLDASATEIFAACGFQDITAQRTRKVIDTLCFVEDRIRTLLATCDIKAPPRAPCPATGNAALWPDEPTRQSAVDAAFTDVNAPMATEGLTNPATFADMDILSLHDRLRLFR